MLVIVSLPLLGRDVGRARQQLLDRDGLDLLGGICVYIYIYIYICIYIYIYIERERDRERYTYYLYVYIYI